MSNPFSMFYDEPDAHGVRDWSMTRVVAFLFTVTYCTVLWKNASNTHLMGYPFMWLGIVTLLAVPIKMLFSSLQEWFSLSPGQKLMTTMLAKFTGIVLDGGATTTTTTTTGDTK